MDGPRDGVPDDPRDDGHGDAHVVAHVVAHGDPHGDPRHAAARRRRRELASLYQGVGVPRVAGAPPRVAIVGAGLAGLTAARVLTLAGCAPAVFEASDRVGGRIRTERGGRDGRQVWELGGEFVDGSHHDVHALARVFGLPMLDTEPAGAPRLAQAYHFEGRLRSEAEVLAAYSAVVPRIAADAARIGARPSARRHTEVDRRFDRLSIAEYLDGLDAERWLLRLIEAAYVNVYGLDAGEQSALNLLTLIGTDTASGFSVFGASDERYKLRDGTDTLTQALADGLGGRIFTGCRLVRLRRIAGGWRLSLDRGGTATEVDADAVVLAIPFSVLREVDLRGVLPAARQRAVDTLGYGRNGKLMLGMRSRPWQAGGFGGTVYSDRAFQSGWDCSLHRGGDEAVFTYYLGGATGLAVGEGDPKAHARRFATLTDEVFPGFSAAWTGEVRRAHWSAEPFALGSYTCYRPGQWTTIGGLESAPVAGGLYFAGEHCAGEAQGYMDGAAGSGRRVAMSLARRLAGAAR